MRRRRLRVKQLIPQIVNCVARMPLPAMQARATMPPQQAVLQGLFAQADRSWRLTGERRMPGVSRTAHVTRLRRLCFGCW